MPRSKTGSYQPPAGIEAVTGSTIHLEAEINAPLPVSAGGTGETTLVGIRDAIGDFTEPSLSALMASNRTYPIGASISTRAEGFAYEVVTSNSDLTTAGGVMLRVAVGLATVTPAMFGAFGAKSVGDLAVVGHASIPDETVKLQRMFSYAVKWGAKVEIGTTDRDYGVAAPIIITPQTSRNKGNTNALASSGLLALHFSNVPSLRVENPGNARIVAKAAMPAMFRINNAAGTYDSAAPYWTEWHGLNLHGNNLATVGIETEWSYRHHYVRCRVFGFDHGWQAKWDAGSHWADCEINCRKSAVWLDNAGDCAITGGDISVQKDGIICGGGNNVRVMGVTFTGNGLSEPELVAVRLFGGSSVVTNWRTRGVHVFGCEGAGIDWLVKGNDSDADGVKEIWNITLTDNHLVRNSFRPKISLIWVKNGYGISLSGNGHGDLLNARAPQYSVYLESCETVSITDAFHGFDGTAIYLKNCFGGSVRSQFSECGVSVAAPIIVLDGCLEFAAVGNSVRWRAASPAATAFIKEVGTSNRNKAGLNAIDTTKLAAPYVVTGSASSMS